MFHFIHSFTLVVSYGFYFLLMLQTVTIMTVPLSSKHTYDENVLSQTIQVSQVPYTKYLTENLHDETIFSSHPPDNFTHQINKHKHILTYLHIHLCIRNQINDLFNRQPISQYPSCICYADGSN